VLEDKLIDAGKTGFLPMVVIPVHFAGQSCDMERIYELSKRFKFTIIEDACHAMGGGYKGGKVGSCRFSDMAVFSFHPVKTITTGEGGMILTNNKEHYEKLNLFRSHGITRDPNNFVNSDSSSPTQNSELKTQNFFPPWYYQQIDLGMNYRITDIQAALGISQLERIDQFVVRRNELAGRYDEALSDLPLTLQRQYPDAYSAFHLLVIRLGLERIKKSRREVFEALHHRGVRVNVHYIPVHTQPYYQSLGFRRGQFPEAERYYEEAITLPLYPSMTEDEQNYVIDSLKEILS
jgi:dTDP-4-amino-4,6-dideoxygalactose transaminase